MTNDSHTILAALAKANGAIARYVYHDRMVWLSVEQGDDQLMLHPDIAKPYDGREQLFLDRCLATIKEKRRFYCESV